MYKVHIEVRIVKRAVIITGSESVEKAVEEAKKLLRAGRRIEWGTAEVEDEVVDVSEI